MSSKKHSNKRKNNFPFANEIKEARYGFKKMIDEMPDEEFMEFILLFLDFVDMFDNEDNNLDEFLEEDYLEDYDDDEYIEEYEDEDLPF